MKRRGLLLAMVVVWLGGCAQTDEPPAPPAATSAQKRQLSKAQAEVAELQRQHKVVKLPPGITGQTHDQFGLPLVITLNPPEVPPEIEGPSPPIKAEPKPPSSGFNPWRWFQQEPNEVQK